MAFGKGRFSPESQPPRRREDLVFENSANSASGSAAIINALAINQRVKSAIGTAEKIERDSRSNEREKRL
jgi:hypothetical protein